MTCSEILFWWYDYNLDECVIIYLLSFWVAAAAASCLKSWFVGFGFFFFFLMTKRKRYDCFIHFLSNEEKVCVTYLKRNCFPSFKMWIAKARSVSVWAKQRLLKSFDFCKAQLPFEINKFVRNKHFLKIRYRQTHIRVPF